MSRPIIKIHNLGDDSIVEREMNNEELVQYEKDLANFETEKQAEAEAAARKAALLAKLGITEEEAKLLLS